MQIYGLFSTKQALTNKKGAPTTALHHRVRFERCVLVSSFVRIFLSFGAIQLLFYHRASLFPLSIRPTFCPNYSAVHIFSC